MIKLFINPGTEPVKKSSVKNAINNMVHLIADSKLKGINCVRIPEKDYGEGRYAFLIWKDRHCLEIQMPGLPLNKVRFMGDGQNAWDFPRLYSDDSSWLWKFAIPEKEDFLCAEDDA